MKSRQIDKKNTFQVRVDIGWHTILTKLRADTKKPIKELVEVALSETYGLDSDGLFKKLPRNT